MANDDLDFLATVPLFRSLTAVELQRVAGTMQRRDVRAGEILDEIGAAATDAYIVRRGRLALELPAPDGHARTVARLGEGTVVGEVCLVEPAPRTLRIRAESDGSILVLDGRRFGVLCDADDPGAHKVLRGLARTLCDRLRQTTVRLQDDLQGGSPMVAEGAAVGSARGLAVDRPWDRLKRLFGRLA